jgi:hypothetical protein
MQKLQWGDLSLDLNGYHATELSHKEMMFIDGGSWAAFFEVALAVLTVIAIIACA